MLTVSRVPDDKRNVTTDLDDEGRRECSKSKEGYRTQNAKGREERESKERGRQGGMDGGRVN